MIVVGDDDRTEYVASALIDYADRNKGRGGLRISVEDLEDTLFSEFGVRFEEAEIRSAIDLLEELELGETIKVGHGRPYFFIGSEQFGRSATKGWNGLLIRMRLDDGLPILGAYSKLGRGWLSENLQIAFADRIEAQQRRADEIMNILAGVSAAIPAADRVVTVEHNAEPIQEIITAADDLASHLARANDVGSLTEAETKAALAEVRQITDSFKADAIRPAVLFERAKATLTWIGSRAAETIVGTLAISLLALIASYLGFAI